jgi:hypothetical protein
MLAICDCKMLVSSDDENIIYGCCCYFDDVLLWIYIKEVFRGYGLSDWMLPKRCKYYWLKGTNKTWYKWIKKKKLIPNPLAILTK